MTTFDKKEIHDRFIVHDVIADELTICELSSELEETINDIFFPHRITTQEYCMAEYDNTNTFTLNKNDKGDNPKRPDYRGKLNVDGIEFTLSGWVREGANGKFISGAVAMVATDERLKPAVEGADEDVPF